MNLLFGDCLEKMNSIPDRSVDAVIVDPPYGRTACKWDSIIPLEPMWDCIERITKPNAAILFFAQTPFDKVLGVSKLEWLRYEWIWEKPAATGFFNAGKMPLKAHENILVFYRSLPTYNPQKTSGHERKVSSRREIGSEVYGKGIRKTHYDSTDRYPRSVQKRSKDPIRKPLHPTQKPVALIEYLIKTYTNENDTVLDFAMGSGTTGVACYNTARKFIGIENSSEYFDVAVQRINAERAT